MPNILPFSNITKNDTLSVGGKGASLGEMTQAGIPVPPGFVVTIEAYKRWVMNGIPETEAHDIFVAFDALHSHRVAVRSSALAEDSSNASWAGQLETYLNVTRDTLIEHIEKCWQSMKSSTAQAYAQEHGVLEDQQEVAVVIQTMVDAEVAGVLFTVNPVSQNEDQMVIEGCYGLGELLVQGSITPANYVVDKTSKQVVQQYPTQQATMLVYRDNETKEIAVPTEKQQESPLSEALIIALVDLGVHIQDHYQVPQDIEWAIQNETIYILQSRPITTLS